MPASALRRVTTQACMLNLLATVLAQVLQHYKKTGVFNPLGALELVPIVQFLVFCVISTPPNVLWQEYLEKHFPAYPPRPEKRKVKVDDDGKVRVFREQFCIFFLEKQELSRLQEHCLLLYLFDVPCRDSKKW